MLIPVDKALKHRVVMLSGDEDNPRRRSLTALLEAACPPGNDFDLEAADATDSTPEQWAASAGTSPFMAERRTVVVRHLLRFDLPGESKPDVDEPKPGVDESKSSADKPKTARKEALARLKSGFASLPPTSLLVLVADDEGGDNDRRRKLAARRTAWEKIVSEVGGLVYSYKAGENVQAVVRRECDELGIKMTPKATELLVEMTGGSVSRALDELDKLALYCGGEPIKDADVRIVVVAAPEWNVFKLVDAVVAGNPTIALQQLRVLVGTATHADAAANQSVFPNLTRQFRLLWQARLCIDAKTTPAQAPPAVAECFPEKPNLAREQGWQQDKAMRNARQMTLPKIARCMRLVSDANAELIGLLPAMNSMETLEQMVLKMVETVKLGR
jgi:DNA polymerase-3 subunit delta